MTEHLSRRCKHIHSHGFTYVALMILVAIMALAITNAMRLGSAMQHRERELALLSIGEKFQKAFRTYYEDTPAGKSRYPSDLEELVRDTRGHSVQRHIRKIYIDPLTGRDWGLVTSPDGKGISGVYSTAEGIPEKTDGFPEALSYLTDKKTYSQWVFGYDIDNHEAGKGNP